MTIEDISNIMKKEVSVMTTDQIRDLALSMGVHYKVIERADREEMIDHCIAIEQHTFVH